MADEQQYEMRLAQGRRRGRSGAQPRAAGPRRRMPASELDRKGLTPKEGSQAVKSKGNFLPPDCTADDAFRLTLTHCKWHILANVPAVVEARQVEGVHQLRVALRRLRVALAAFGHDFRTPAIEALRMRAKILASGLGPARDMDVFLTELMAPAEADASVPKAFDALRARAQARRDEAWESAVREASGLAFHTFVHDLTEAIDQRHWYDLPTGAAPGTHLATFEMKARALADRQLAHRLKAAKKKAKNLKTLSETERHRLRIALKKLRYSVEFFATLYPVEAVKPFVRRLAAMQDILGLLQDVAVARTTLHGLVEQPPAGFDADHEDVCFAAGTVYGWHLARADEAWTEAKQSWKRLVEVTPFWDAA